MTRIVTSTYRYKRPPRKRKAVPLEMPSIVRARRFGPVVRHDASNVQSQSATAQIAPANGDRNSAIVTTSRRRRPKLEPEIDLETEARVKAFILRMMRP
jgi:hypothetical protein